MDRKGNAEQRIQSLATSARSPLIIHYSSESLKDKETGYFPRILAIAIKDRISGITELFSIAIEADLKSLKKEEIVDNLDELERLMLDKFFVFISRHKHNPYVHWNMRDINYGFPAIYQRYRTLKGSPITLSESVLYNLADLLHAIYGPKYVPDPKLESLIDRNLITKLGFVRGQDEPALFQAKEFVKLQNSTMRKAECIAAILELQLSGQLKTAQSAIKERWQRTYNHPALQVILVVSAVASIVGLILTIIAFVR